MIGSFRLINASQPGLTCLALILDIPHVYLEFVVTSVVLNQLSVKPEASQLDPNHSCDPHNTPTLRGV